MQQHTSTHPPKAVGGPTKRGHGDVLLNQHSQQQQPADSSKRQKQGEAAALHRRTPQHHEPLPFPMGPRAAAGAGRASTGANGTQRLGGAQADADAPPAADGGAGDVDRIGGCAGLSFGRSSSGFLGRNSISSNLPWATPAGSCDDLAALELDWDADQLPAAADMFGAEAAAAADAGVRAAGAAAARPAVPDIPGGGWDAGTAAAAGDGADGGADGGAGGDEEEGSVLVDEPFTLQAQGQEAPSFVLGRVMAM